MLPIPPPPLLLDQLGQATVLEPQDRLVLYHHLRPRLPHLGVLRLLQAGYLVDVGNEHDGVSARRSRRQEVPMIVVRMVVLAVAGEARRERRHLHPRRSHVEHEYVAAAVGQAQPVNDVADDQRPEVRRPVAAPV